MGKCCTVSTPLFYCSEPKNTYIINMYYMCTHHCPAAELTYCSWSVWAGVDIILYFGFLVSCACFQMNRSLILYSSRTKSKNQIMGLKSSAFRLWKCNFLFDRGNREIRYLFSAGGKHRESKSEQAFNCVLCCLSLGQIWILSIVGTVNDIASYQ